MSVNRDRPRWGWADTLIVLAMLLFFGISGWSAGDRERATQGEGTPCGCVPPPGRRCRMPCTSCCPGGCKPQDPPPSAVAAPR